MNLVSSNTAATTNETTATSIERTLDSEVEVNLFFHIYVIVVRSSQRKKNSVYIETATFSPPTRFILGMRP